MAIRNVAASPELRELISKYLIEQMRPVLRAARPTRREAAVERLGAANFGTPRLLPSWTGLWLRQRLSPLRKRPGGRGPRCGLPRASWVDYLSLVVVPS
jgi:hypothetical protein